ncbi:Ger(x)C family spore germination protein [Paenibacillus filicis]|uniref:Ger(X)C family spore germination protein n=1 Tax=Paenibacillus gyeongsangnamensis TaxID=3388067 RepID=A0ABT4Q5L6_9BACL|nr:Ger(x)C family spore germination protein [Paenibacillus filicis]MCZ8512171.1 Ger(x)C family spore germination protein [Paenibacillus filicis]
MRAVKLCLLLLLTVSNTTGCWNLREPNQLAFDLGSGLDLTKDGLFEFSAQIAIPSGVGGGQDGGGGNKKESFRTLSATGENIYDAIQKLQTKLSRKVFLGHRQIILIGQRMAEFGMSKFLDEFVRNPESEMRSLVYVVKEGQAKDILNVNPFFDPFTANALVSGLDILAWKHNYYRDFLSDALSQGIQPMVPAVSLTASSKFIYSGAAIFNKDNGMKLVGFLNIKEAVYANWIRDRQENSSVTAFVTQGNGNVSVKLQSLNRRIRVKMVNERMKIDVHLTGKGTIVENNSSLNPSKPKDLQIIQDELGQTTQRSINQLIEKVQKQYKTDIFGFGESVHQQYPHQWKTLKDNWTETFPQLPVSVQVELQCKDPGRSNSSP